MEARKLISGAITALLPTNVDLLIQTPQTFSTHTKNKNHRYIKPYPSTGKTAYKGNCRYFKYAAGTEFL
jgi:hypothetical protein